MRRLLALTAVVLVGSCGGVSGDIGKACMAAGREAANQSLCSCVQQVADQTLTGSEQNRAAAFFTNPDKAQETRQSTSPRDDQFWDRYRAFADRAEAVCG